MSDGYILFGFCVTVLAMLWMFGYSVWKEFHEDG